MAVGNFSTKLNLCAHANFKYFQQESHTMIFNILLGMYKCTQIDWIAYKNLTYAYIIHVHWLLFIALLNLLFTWKYNSKFTFNSTFNLDHVHIL